MYTLCEKITFKYQNLQIFKGNFPSESSFTIIAGLVFFISAPIVGSRFINHTSFCFIEIFKINVGKSNQFSIVFIIRE